MKVRFIVGVLALVALAACGSGDSGDKTVEGDAVTVKMLDSSFEFTEIRVPVGGTVTFVLFAIFRAIYGSLGSATEA